MKFEMISEPKFVMIKNFYGTVMFYPLYNYFSLHKYDDGHFEITIKEDVGSAAEYDSFDISEDEYNRQLNFFIALSSSLIQTTGGTE